MNVSEAISKINERLDEIHLLLVERKDDVLDLDGVMSLTGLSRSALYQKTCSRGGAPPELPHYKTGKRLYFRRSEIEAWMTQNRVRNRAEIEAAAATYNATNQRRRA